MSLADIKRQGYRLQRGASNGASVTLVAGCGEYTALFECAMKCMEVLGDSGFTDLGDGILDIVPHYKIATEDLYKVLQKLSTKFSVALVEHTTTRMGGRFVCLWRINAAPTKKPEPEPYSYDVSEY